MKLKTNNYYKRFIRYLLTEPSTFLHTFNTLRHAARFYQHSLLKTANRAYLLLRRYGFSPQEAYPLGLLNPTNKKNESLGFISKAAVLERQHDINPASWCQIIKDKSIFYRYCQALQLPIPNLYALFFQGASGWNNSNHILISKNNWCDFFNQNLPEKFIIKPATGSHGDEVALYIRQKNGFVNHKLQYFESEDLYELLQNHPAYYSFIIQEALLNHPSLRELSDADGLQTVRITTFIDPQGHCHIEHACFKPIVGNGIIDNHNNGQYGNLLSHVNIKDGTIVKTVVTTAEHKERQSVHQHPTTRIKLTNFQLPMWNEACELAVHAAKQFLPLRTIGWDIALTPTKPVIIEGNQHWDPPNLEPHHSTNIF
ncbi:sugar-transfer associated ATP-grasp domain-containing protein [Legionella parisiensis]|uniref:Alpha-L-glutamate ligase-related protein ATP-grasp domain-containing protein n=1 Tax=Legionella parisiensis TaxID=45071 RepID=A0A1E5JVM8_9GAMM|nr:sugar-transfer associated ATP-grasp domain-containing protein [Legionella parisiensis]KTD43140.1 hypothetical protein Lpar_1117 [Legionella parisiensis]OEH48582.1 hypothetical protein lpari_00417 [Legionella parisiensis]STX77781.1 alpha-L-glutamate ligase homolog [Legionella parisiensis]